MIGIKVKKLTGEAQLPHYANDFASGMDLFCLVRENEISLYPNEVTKIRTGLAVEIPFGYEGQVRPRSGWSSKNVCTIINSPGTIDCDYRGEIVLLVYNGGDHVVHVSNGDRIAQLVIAPVARVAIEEVEQLALSDRGIKGFGSTGR